MKKVLLGMALTLAAATPYAATTTYAGASPIVSNCIPFGCPDAYDPHMGFVYKNLGAFTLNAGDIIAFDTGRTNDMELRFDLSLAATTTNGGTTASGPFTMVSSLGLGHFGDNIVGNYDLAFVASSSFSFAGGGLIVDFTNTNGAVNDGTGEQNLVYSSSNPYTVRRYFNGTSVGDMSHASFGDGPDVVGNMRIITNNVTPIPEPETYAMMLAGLGMLGFMARRRKLKAAA
jgi:hypothetical protein